MTSPTLTFSLSRVRAFMGFSIKSSLTNLATNAKKKKRKVSGKIIAKAVLSATTSSQQSSKNVCRKCITRKMYYFGTQQNTTTIELLEYEFPVITRTQSCTVYHCTKSTGLTYTCLYRKLYSLGAPFQNFIQDL